MSKFQIIWTTTAKNQLKSILSYYKDKSTQAAESVKKDIFEKVKSIHFPEQYQADDIEPEFRKIIVRDYKILYLEQNNFIYIARIFSTKMNPLRPL